ncbi:clusterin-like protein 1 [Chanos chanos]|uniref:Clusterin n=1 Tax=Chanos chanos TaxID=29144 RepID=A0A6J2VPY8_CHACN|nr:clusterin-like protein 1 [Chanos chanos]
MAFVLLNSFMGSAAGKKVDDNDDEVLSAKGQQYVDEEIKRALFGVKHMKEVMDREENKHEQLIKTLKTSYEKKMGVEQLVQEAEQKLLEAEQDCHDRLRPMWEECRLCLEDRCRIFYTSTCRRSYTAFTVQVEEMFRRMASQLDQNQDLVFNQNLDILTENQNKTQQYQETEKHDQIQKSNQTHTIAGPGPSGLDQDLVWVKTSFGRIQVAVDSLYADSLALVSAMRRELGPAFYAAFTTEVQPGPPLLAGIAQTGAPQEGMDLSRALGSFVELGRSVLHEVSSAITEVFDEDEESIGEGPTQRGSGWLPAWAFPSKQLCRHLRRQASECRQLKSQCENCQEALLTECPTVPQFYTELGEITLLMNESRRQYEEFLQVIHTYTEDTRRWAESAMGKHAWITHIADGSTPPHIFSLIKVVLGNTGATVEVSVLDSPVLSVTVPAGLEESEPAFIQYIAQEALLAYKQTLSSSTLR